MGDESVAVASYSALFEEDPLPPGKFSVSCQSVLAGWGVEGKATKCRRVRLNTSKILAENTFSIRFDVDKPPMVIQKVNDRPPGVIRDQSRVLFVFPGQTFLTSSYEMSLSVISDGRVIGVFYLPEGFWSLSPCLPEEDEDDDCHTWAFTPTENFPVYEPGLSNSN